MRLVGVAAVLGALSVTMSCEPVGTRQGIQVKQQCEPSAVLEAVGRAIETGNVTLCQPVVLRTADLALLMGNTSEALESTSADDEAIFSVVRQMVNNWHVKLKGASYVRAQPGTHRSNVRLENVSRGAEVIEDSVLVFRTHTGETMVPVDRLILVRSCWKVEDVSYPSSRARTRG